MALTLLLSPIFVGAQDEAREGESAKVTAVYGVTADDYLPEKEHAAYSDLKKPKKYRGTTRPIFDLPDVFYFVGGPIFLLILLRVLVIFIAGFEEKKKDEENHVASEHFNLD